MKTQLLSYLLIFTMPQVTNAQGIVLSKPTQSEHALKNYQWKKRVLILLSDSAQNADFVEARIQLLTRKQEVLDRDLVTIVETQSQGPWHQRFDSKHSFEIILIGKDGGEKWRSHQALKLDEVFQVIDGMPMRKSEIHSKR